MPEKIPCGEIGPASSGVLPDPNICCARPMGQLQSFAACLVAIPFDCPHAIPATGGTFCTNVKWKDFVKA